MILPIEVYEKMYRVDTIKEKAKELVFAGKIDDELWQNRIKRCWQAIEKQYGVILFDADGYMLEEQQFHFAKYSLARICKCSVGQFVYTNSPQEKIYKLD